MTFGAGWNIVNLLTFLPSKNNLFFYFSSIGAACTCSQLRAYSSCSSVIMSRKPQVPGSHCNQEYLVFDHQTKHHDSYLQDILTRTPGSRTLNIRRLVKEFVSQKTITFEMMSPFWLSVCACVPAFV